MTNRTCRRCSAILPAEARFCEQCGAAAAAPGVAAPTPPETPTLPETPLLPETLTAPETLTDPKTLTAPETETLSRPAPSPVASESIPPSAAGNAGVNAGRSRVGGLAAGAVVLVALATGGWWFWAGERSGSDKEAPPTAFDTTAPAERTAAETVVEPPEQVAQQPTPEESTQDDRPSSPAPDRDTRRARVPVAQVPAAPTNPIDRPAITSETAVVPPTKDTPVPESRVDTPAGAGSAPQPGNLPATPPAASVPTESAEPAARTPPPVAAPAPYRGPLNGTLTYSGPPVVQNAEVVFERLPPVRLKLSYPADVWDARLAPGENNTQRLILRNKKPGTQKKCVVQWEVIP